MKYLLDSNIFIQTRKLLATDVWPSFWGKLSQLANEGVLYSIQKVKDELTDDDIYDWIISNTGPDFFMPLDAQCMASYSQLQIWANQQQYTQSAKIEFASSSIADPFLIAMAHAKQMTVVTLEKSRPTRQKKIMIPDVCNAFNIPCCDLSGLFRELSITI